MTVASTEAVLPVPNSRQPAKAPLGDAPASGEAATRVRLAGERAQQLMREQRAHGVALYPAIMPSLATWVQKLGVDVPGPVQLPSGG